MITRLLLSLLSAALVLPLSALAEKDSTIGGSAKGGLRYSISVTKFENRSNFSGQWSIADTWGAILTDSLQQSGKFIVLGENDMRGAALAEQDLAASGRAAGGGKTVATGNLTPAQLLVKGEITHFQASTTGGNAGVGIKGFRLGVGGDQAEINAVVYVVDSTTGQVVSSKRVAGVAKKSGLTVGYTDRDWGADLGGFKKTNVGKAVEAAIDEAVAFISSQVADMPWTGSVILVKGNQVYINRGSREGVTAGQSFKVGASEILRDPDTGETLDISFEEKAQLKVDSVREKMSICTITSGEGVERGMTVTLP